jgi:AcrR family transcriptional regulator
VQNLNATDRYAPPEGLRPTLRPTDQRTAAMNSDHAEANLPAPAAPDDDSRKRILDAALSEFTENGMAGARVSAIAAQAGVNQQLIYYYGSKAQLYQHVIEWRLGDGAAHYQDAENVSSTSMALGNRPTPQPAVRLCAALYVGSAEPRRRRILFGD